MTCSSITTTTCIVVLFEMLMRDKIISLFCALLVMASCHIYSNSKNPRRQGTAWRLLRSLPLLCAFPVE
eukprot:3210989-Amphidinium_carterae.1